MKKRFLAGAFVLTTLLTGIAYADICYEQAGECGTIVAVDMPESGTCHGHSHDKLATVTSYDANGNFYATDGHVCGIGPC